MMKGGGSEIVEIGIAMEFFTPGTWAGLVLAWAAWHGIACGAFYGFSLSIMHRLEKREVVLLLALLLLGYYSIPWSSEGRISSL